MYRYIRASSPGASVAAAPAAATSPPSAMRSAPIPDLPAAVGDPAAVGGHAGSCDVARVVRGQEHRHPGHFLDRPEAPERRAPLDVRARVVAGTLVPLVHRRLDVGRIEADDPDAVARPLRAQHFREADQAVLAGAVGGPARQAHLPE